MKGTGFQKISLIRVGYVVILGVFVILAFFPYFSETFTYGPHSYTEYFPGWFELIFGGWVGIGLIVLSAIRLNSQRTGKPIIFGISGCILILINLIIRTVMLGITIEISFYLSFVFLLGLFVINPLSYVFREKEVESKPIPKFKKEKGKIEKMKEVGIDREEKELIKKQIIEYIERLQLKTTELPYFKIISETGITREDLDPLVKEMISQNKINAKVRDYVILFQEISPEKKEEELNKIKKEIQQKIAQGDNLIKIDEFSAAIKNLNEVKETAKTFGLLDFIKTTEIKIKECKKLEIERKKELEKERIKEELQLRIVEVDKQIKDNKFKNAIKSLEKVKKTAIDYNLLEFINKAEELKKRCETLELDYKKDKEEAKIKSELHKKMLEVNKMIDQKKFSVAIENLNQIINSAEIYELKDLVNKAKEKTNQCKKHEIKWKKEEEKRTQENLKTQMAEVNSLIKEGITKAAIKNLAKIKATAKEYNLVEFLNEAEELENQCKALELEIKENKEKIKIEKKLQKNLLNVENLIEENKVYEALEDLVEIKEIANKNELVEFVKKIEGKIEYCKNFQINTINKIKKTIINYGSKLARLELMDISEKSGIQDENLIEKIILEMITNREIKAEYFSSSKSIAFYQQEKGATPIAKVEEIKKLRVFLSYSTLDAEHFQISEIVKNLEVFPEIKKVSYWEADSNQNIVEFMEETLKNTDVFVLFCSPNSVKSGAVKDEWQAAFQMRKKGLLKIIPVYEDEDFIPVLLWQMLNVKFIKDNFSAFIEKLYEEILR